MDIDTAIEENRLLIYKIAKKFYNIDINDLFQAGCIGVIKALKHFVDDGTCKFSTFAYKYIFGEMYELSIKSKKMPAPRSLGASCRQLYGANRKHLQL